MSDRPARVVLVGSQGFLGTAMRDQFEPAGIEVVEATSGRPVDDLTDGDIAGAVGIFWAASGVTPAGAAADPSRALTELDYFSRSVDRMRQLAPQARLVLASSGGTVYATDTEPPYGEDDPTGSAASYGKMKLAMESVTVDAGGTCLRFSNLYGPGQIARRGLGVIAHWVEALRTGQPIRVFGNPENSRDYLFIEDAARAAVAASLHASALPPALNVGSGSPTSLGRLIEILRSLPGVEDVRVEQLDDPRPFDRSATWLNIGLVQESLGWIPRVGLEDGIQATWDASSPKG